MEPYYYNLSFIQFETGKNFEFGESANINVTNLKFHRRHKNLYTDVCESHDIIVPSTVWVNEVIIPEIILTFILC